MRPTILIVIPTFSHFEYAVRAVESAFTNTKTFEPHVVVFDDASPDFHARVFDHAAPREIVTANLRVFRFNENGGLTRSWNHGLGYALERNFDACCVTNSDVIFAPGWDHDVFTALNSDKYALVGPVTNTPGTNSEQYVGRYSVLYDPMKKDDTRHIQHVQDELFSAQSRRFKETTLNGFCMAAFTKTWWANAYDENHVFRPRNDLNSKGEPNPTPLMTLNEYELQGRWHAKGLKTAACLGSYVFHYRAVSRGDKHKRGDWVRIKKESA